jgi:hypothetical protein
MIHYCFTVHLLCTTGLPSSEYGSESGLLGDSDTIASSTELPGPALAQPCTLALNVREWPQQPLSEVKHQLG